MLNAIVLTSNNPKTTLACVKAITSDAESKLRFFGSVKEDAIVNDPTGWTECNLFRVEEWVNVIKQRLFDAVVVNDGIVNRLLSVGITPECLVRDGGLLIHTKPERNSKKPYRYFNGVPLSERDSEPVEYEHIDVEKRHVVVHTQEESHKFSTFGVTFKDTAEVAAFIETKMAALCPGFKVSLKAYERLSSLVKDSSVKRMSGIRTIGCQRLLIEVIDDECVVKRRVVTKDKLTGYDDFKASLGDVDLTPEQYDEILTAREAMEAARAKSPAVEKIEWTDKGVMVFYRDEAGEITSASHNPDHLQVEALGRRLTKEELRMLENALILGNKRRVEATRSK